MLAHEDCPAPIPQISNGSTVPIAGWCEFFPPGCSYDGITLLSIWSSMAARQGEHAGVFFDPKASDTRYDRVYDPYAHYRTWCGTQQ